MLNKLAAVIITLTTKFKNNYTVYIEVCVVLLQFNIYLIVEKMNRVFVQFE